MMVDGKSSTMTNYRNYLLLRLLPLLAPCKGKTRTYHLEDGKLQAGTLQSAHPVLWRHQFEPSITANLVSWENPKGQINNSELELAGGILHNEATAQCFDVRERTIKAATDNTATLHWMRKGTVTGTDTTTKLLRMHGLHQRFHRYVHLIDYLQGDRNNMADDASRLFHLTDSQLLLHFETHYPQTKSWHLWRLPPQTVSAITTILHNKTSPREWWLHEPAPPASNGPSGWANYCAGLGLDPTLQDIDDPVPILQVFAYRFRNGIISPSQSKVRSRTVEDALRSIGQTFQALGAEDPRINRNGRTDFRIQRMLSAYKKQDPPPNRVKPVPVQILRHITPVSAQSTDENIRAVSDMIALAFFFLLRPGEWYTGTKSDTAPFRIQDVGLFIGQQRLDVLQSPIAALWNATFVTLEFTTQKNGVRGEVVGLGCSGTTELCPVFAVVRRLVHLRQHGASPATPLATFFDTRKHKLQPVSPADITATLRLAAQILGPQLGFLPKDISARSLRAAGAMALLCGHVDTDIIRLLGRWRSDEMLRYLHPQAAPLMRDFAPIMLQGGSFVLLPNNEVPIY